MFLLALWGGLGSAMAATASASPALADPGVLFDEAARLYEQGRPAEAAQAYERLLTNGVVTAAVHFNQGNAWLKAEQVGRAIAAYRRALRLAPRDRDIGANLRLARARLPAGVAHARGLSGRVLDRLTPNEWSGLALAAVWISGLVFVGREVLPRYRTATRGLARGLGGVAVLAVVAAVAASRDVHRAEAVVAVPEVAVRFGPLRESQEAFTLPDGAEVRVRDRKDAWLKVRDAGGREGWVPRDDVVELGGPIKG